MYYIVPSRFFGKQITILEANSLDGLFIMAEVLWKETVWSGAHREMSIKALLTTLKGYGPMELLFFEKPGEYKGMLNVWLDEHGTRHLTLYDLQVTGQKRKGKGRKALKELRWIFGGDIYVEHPGILVPEAKEDSSGSHTKGADQDSVLFWIKMFEEKIIKSVEDDFICLQEDTPLDQLENIKREAGKLLNDNP
jgi:hypothetical protein